MTTNYPTVAEMQARSEIMRIARPRRPVSERFSPGRYPYTYASDHVRTRGLAASREEASEFIKQLAAMAGLPIQYVTCQFAEAYILDNNVERRL